MRNFIRNTVFAGTSCLVPSAWRKHGFCQKQRQRMLRYCHRHCLKTPSPEPQSRLSSSACLCVYMYQRLSKSMSCTLSSASCWFNHAVGFNSTDVIAVIPSCSFPFSWFKVCLLISFFKMFIHCQTLDQSSGQFWCCHLDKFRNGALKLTGETFISADLSGLRANESQLIVIDKMRWKLSC